MTLLRGKSRGQEVSNGAVSAVSGWMVAFDFPCLCLMRLNSTPLALVLTLALLLVMVNPLVVIRRASHRAMQQYRVCGNESGRRSCGSLVLCIVREVCEVPKAVHFACKELRGGAAKQNSHEA